MAYYGANRKIRDDIQNFNTGINTRSNSRDSRDALHEEALRKIRRNGDVVRRRSSRSMPGIKSRGSNPKNSNPKYSNPKYNNPKNTRGIASGIRNTQAERQSQGRKVSNNLRRGNAGYQSVAYAHPLSGRDAAGYRNNRNNAGNRVRVRNTRPRNSGNSAQRRRSGSSAYNPLVSVFMALCFFGVIGFAGIQGLSMIFSLIENSRESQRGEIETTIETEGIDLSDNTLIKSDLVNTAEMPQGEQEAKMLTLEAETVANNGLVLSGGRYVDLSKPMVALTFDDGPKSSVGNVIMDELEKVDGRGTFFIVGNRVEEFADEVNRIVANGHEVANHSWDHDNKLKNKSSDYIRQEFSKADDIIKQVSGVDPALIRLPGGGISDEVRSTITKPMIYWSVDTEDWKTRNAQSTIDCILYESNISDGDIVLMHELYTATADACKVVIPELVSRGFQLVTVSELIKFHNAEVAGGNGIQYEKFPPQETAAETLAETAQESSLSAAAAQETAPNQEGLLAGVDNNAANAENAASNVDNTGNTEAANVDNTANAGNAAAAITETAAAGAGNAGGAYEAASATVQNTDSAEDAVARIFETLDVPIDNTAPLESSTQSPLQVNEAQVNEANEADTGQISWIRDDLT